MVKNWNVYYRQDLIFSESFKLVDPDRTPVKRYIFTSTMWCWEMQTVIAGIHRKLDQAAAM